MDERGTKLTHGPHLHKSPERIKAGQGEEEGRRGGREEGRISVFIWRETRCKDADCKLNFEHKIQLGRRNILCPRRELLDGERQK